MLRSALDAYPNDAEGHALMGRLLRERNDAGGAMAHLESAIRFNESLIPPYIEKANLQMLAGQIAAAWETLALSQQQDRNNLLVRGFLAKLLALQQKPEDALREAAAVLASMPNNEDAMVARGDALLQVGNHEEAVRQFRQLTALRPKYSYYWHRLGVVEAVRGDSVNAVVHLRKAIELKPDLGTAVNDLVRFQSQLKQFDAAKSGSFGRSVELGCESEKVEIRRSGDGGHAGGGCTTK
jgi:Flp pilus assembly protein TadD